MAKKIKTADDLANHITGLRKTKIVKIDLSNHFRTALLALKAETDNNVQAGAAPTPIDHYLKTEPTPTYLTTAIKQAAQKARFR